MARDPIVEELHETRQALLEEFGGIEGYLRHIEQLQTELKDRIVSREPRKPVVATQKAS
jgi:hypothetical protein